MQGLHRYFGNVAMWHWEIMDETVQKSCWGVTVKAVVGIACLMLLVWLVSGADATATNTTKAVFATAQ